MDIWVIQTIAVLAAVGFSAAVAAGTWYWALRGAERLRAKSRRDARKHELYLSAIEVFADVMANATGTHRKATRQRPEDIARRQLESKEFRLKQLELNMIAPDDVVRKLSWHGQAEGISEEEQGNRAMLRIAELLLAIRRDAMGKKTKLKPEDMWACFLGHDGADLLRSVWNANAGTEPQQSR